MTIIDAPPAVSERHRVIADTAIAVLEELEADVTTSLLRTIAELLGVTISALRQAHQRWKSEDWEPPGGGEDFDDEPEPAARPEPPPEFRIPTPIIAAEREVAEALQNVDRSKPERGGPKRRSSAVTPRRPGEGEKKTCVDCAQELPIEDFIVKRQYRNGREIGSPVRSSNCHSCRREKSRRRYLTTAQINTVAGILRMELLEGDQLIGKPCQRCGGALHAGELVDVKTADITHHECPVSE